MTIVSILAAMLLPALGKARQEAKIMQCVSQQRQIAIGIHQYADNFGDYLVVGGAAGNWRQEVRPYVAPDSTNDWANLLRKGGVFVCPLFPEAIRTSTRSGLAFNYLYLGYSDTDRRRRRDVSRPTHTIMIGDSSDDVTSGWYPVHLYPPGICCGPGERHRGGGHFALVDAHVEWLARTRLLIEPSWYWRVQ